MPWTETEEQVECGFNLPHLRFRTGAAHFTTVWSRKKLTYISSLQ